MPTFHHTAARAAYLRRLFSCLLLVASSFAAVSCLEDDDEELPRLQERDLDFVVEAAANNYAEIEFGELATLRGGAAAVQSFGQQMVADHSFAQNQLRALANRYRIGVFVELDSAQAALRDSLLGISGTAFDTTYLRQQVQMHEAALDVLRYGRDSSAVQDIRSYATQQTPVVQQHLLRAQELLDSLRTTGNDD